MHMPTKNTNTATAATAAATKQSVKRTKRTRRNLARGPVIAHPAVRYGEIDGAAVAYVGLSGKGYQREMILDAPKWEMVAERWGTRWVLIDGSQDYPYVGSGRAAVAPLAAQDGPCPVVILARLLTSAGADQVVRFRNGDRMDMRMCNLIVLSGPEAHRWTVGGQAFLDSFDVAD